MFFVAENLGADHENTKERKHEKGKMARLSYLRSFVINFVRFGSGSSRSNTEKEKNGLGIESMGFLC
jgi:hypothetical protein